MTSLSLIQLIRSEIQDITITKTTDCEEVAALKQLVGHKLEKRLPLTDDALLATLLDPSTKDLVAMESVDHAEKFELSVKAVADLYRRCVHHAVAVKVRLHQHQLTK